MGFRALKGVPVEHIHLGQFGDVGDVKSLLEDGLNSRVVEHGFAAEEHSEVSLFRRLEGFECIGIRLDGVEGSSDSVVENDHGSPILSSRIGGEVDGLQQIGRAIYRSLVSHVHNERPGGTSYQQRWR